MVVVPSFPPKVNKRFWWKLELWGVKGSSIGSTWGYPIESIDTGGEGGIRTPGRGFSPYNGLANRRIQPLCHLSADGSAEANRPNAPSISLNRGRKRSEFLAGMSIPGDHFTSPCVKESGSVASEGSAEAGREFFPF